VTGVELSVLHSVALGSLLAWASGIRLYLVMFAIGMAGHFDYMDLPKGLEVLQHPWVLGAAGFMVLIEFLADKIPAVDSAWDAIHTFIRIPAGALLAAGATGDSLSALTVAAGILGGSITAGTHFTKAGSRAMINTSPEPVSNWFASFTEDAVVLSGIWLALTQPLVFLLLLLLFLLMLVWLIPKLWRGIKSVVDRVNGEPRRLPPAGA
jgi:hypothetical protein